MLYWIIVGIIARWLAGKLVHCEGFGLIGDLILGLIGGLVGGSLFGALGKLLAQGTDSRLRPSFWNATRDTQSGPDQPGSVTNSALCA
ncbi:MAG: hypothetical protein WCA22_19680 [Candidatus Binatus sp.]